MRTPIPARLSALVAATAIGLGTVAFSPATAESADPITIHLGQPGLQFRDWGFDIKQSSNDTQNSPSAKLANDAGYASQVFGNGKMTVLRIPIRANSDGVRTDGLVRREYYATVIKATKNALAVNPNLKIYASRSTITNDEGSVSPYDYANSLKDDEADPTSPVVMWKYARMLADYLDVMSENGIAVSVLGVENEPKNNEGGITPDRYKALIGYLDNYYDKPMPKLIMADAANARSGFIADAADDPYVEGDSWSVLTYAGTHYRSDSRDGMRDALKTHADIALRDHPAARKDLTAWDTEYHWIDHDQDGSTPETYSDAVDGVLGAFDHPDLGYTGVVWWGYRPCRDASGAHTCSAGPKAAIQSALVDSTGGSSRLPTDDADGTTTNRGQLITRSFKSGGDVYMWVVNDRDSAAWSQVIDVPNVTQTSSPKFERWTRGANGNLGGRESGQGTLSGGDGVLSFPARSITLVRLAGVA